MYIRAIMGQLLWVSASVMSSVGGVVDTLLFLQDAKEDVCGNVHSGYSRLRGKQNYF